MNKEKILNIVLSIINENAEFLTIKKKDHLSPTDNLISDIGFDPIALCELHLLCEEKFSTYLINSKFKKITNIQSLVELIESSINYF